MAAILNQLFHVIPLLLDCGRVKSSTKRNAALSQAELDQSPRKLRVSTVQSAAGKTHLGVKAHGAQMTFPFDHLIGGGTLQHTGTKEL